MAYNLVQRNTITNQEAIIGSYSGDDAEFYAQQDCKRFNQYLLDDGKFSEFCFVRPIAIVG